MVYIERHQSLPCWREQKGGHHEGGSRFLALEMRLQNPIARRTALVRLNTSALIIHSVLIIVTPLAILVGQS